MFPPEDRLQLAEEDRFIDVVLFCNALDIEIPLDLIPHFCDDLHERADSLRLSLRRFQQPLCDKGLGFELQKRDRLPDQRRELPPSLLPHERVGIIPRGKSSNLDIEAVFDHQIDTTHRGFRSGGVGIVHENDGLCIAADQLDLLHRESRAAGGDDVLDSCLEDGE